MRAEDKEAEPEGGGWRKAEVWSPLTGITLQASGVSKAPRVSDPRAKISPSSSWSLWYATGCLAQWPQLLSPKARPQPWHYPNPGSCVQVTAELAQEWAGTVSCACMFPVQNTQFPSDCLPAMRVRNFGSRFLSLIIQEQE